MELKDFWTIIKAKKQTIVSVVVLIVVITAVLTMIQPFKYEAKAKLIVIQEFDSKVDPYAISKSNEYLSSLLANVATSNTFYNKVLGGDTNIKRIYFKDTINKQIAMWQETIVARSVNDSGIIDLSIYHPDTAQARLILDSAIVIMQKSHGDFHGAPNKVEIKVLDETMISTWPVKPNFALNFGLGFGLGLVIALSYVYLFPGKKHDLKLMPTRSIKENEDNGISFERAENNWETVGEVLERQQRSNLNHLYDNSEKEVEKQRKVEEVIAEKEILFDNQESEQEAKEIVQNGNMKNIIG